MEYFAQYADGFSLFGQYAGSLFRFDVLTCVI